MPLRPVLSALERAGGGGGGTTAPRTVLVVEREENVRALIRRVLKSEGYAIEEAGDAGEAVAVLSARGTAVDLVVAELIEPGITGSGLISQLPPGTRVLLLSLFSDDVAVPKEFAGTIAVLTNPFRGNALCERVREILEGRGK